MLRNLLSSRRAANATRLFKLIEQIHTHLSVCARAQKSTFALYQCTALQNLILSFKKRVVRMQYVRTHTVRWRRQPKMLTK